MIIHGDNSVRFSEEEYDAMRSKLLKLQALEAAGVDNWCGYDDAMEIYRELKGDDE